MSTDTIAGQCERIIAVLNDGKPHESNEIYARTGHIPSATLARRLVELRASGHDIRKVTDRRDWQRKARVVEYQLLPPAKKVQRMS